MGQAQARAKARAGAALAAVLVWLATGAAFSQDIVPNGGFEQGLAGWRLSQQSGAQGSAVAQPTAGAVGNAAKVAVATPNLAHHIQFFCDFDSALLEPGEAYCLSFLVRADPPRTFSVKLLNNKAPWGLVGLSETVSASPAWRKVRVVFRAGRPREKKLRLDFFFGDAAGTVWLDEIKLARYARPAPPKPDGPALEGRAWKLQFYKNGAVAQFAHKPTGQVLLRGDPVGPVYEVLYRVGEEERRETSADAQGVDGGAVAPGRLRWRFRHREFQVECAVALDEESDLARFSVRVLNSGPGAIVAIRYPILAAPDALGASPADDCILYPQCDGGLIENPKEAFSRGPNSIESTYPGPLSCQLVAYYDGRAGLYLACYDAQGWPKAFRVALGADLTFQVAHLLPILPGKDAQVSYPAVLGAFSGDWHDAAEIYRQWSRKQSWCAKPLAEQRTTPRWLRRGALVTYYNPRAKDSAGKPKFQGAGLSRWLDELVAQYHAPLIVNNRGWERYGEWTGQEYLPPYPSAEEFRAQARAIRAAGGLGMIMLSGYRWTIEKKLADGTVYSSAERFFREVAPFAVFDLAGKAPVVHTSANPRDFHGQRWAQLCRATEFAKKTIVDVARYCVEAGYPIIHFDQEVSGAVYAGLCGSRSHGHPPGWGKWIHEELADLFRRIREACAPLDEDFALSMEEPNELYLPYLQLCQSRPFGLTAEFPIRRPMTRSVPLFCYLYHDYVVGWAAFYPWKSAGHPRYSLAKGFAAGLMPGIAVAFTSRMRQAERAAYETMFNNLMRAYLGYAREFLLWGKMLRPLELDVPTRELNLGPRWGKYSAPAVFHSVWQLRDGRVGVVLINPETEAHQVSLNLLRFPQAQRRKPALYTLQGKRELAGARCAVEVPPLELVLVELR